MEGRERINLFLILSGTALILPQLGFSYLLLSPHEQANKNCGKEGERRATAKVESLKNNKKKTVENYFLRAKDS